MPPRKRIDSKWWSRFHGRTAGFTWGTSICASALLVGVVAMFYRLATLALAGEDIGTKFLLNADPDVLNTVFHSRTPHIFYCHERGNPEYVPKKLEAAHTAMGNREFRLAVLNCSQVVPSGKQIFDAFKLQREWRPVVFATAPWVDRAVQLPPTKLKNKGGLLAAKYLSSALFPREKNINNDTEFQDQCGADIAAANGGRTCVLALKGSLFSDTQQDTLSALVRTFQNPSTRIVSVSAKKRWLSVDSSILSRKFAMRLYVIRDGTHHTSLATHATTENAVDFVQRAIQDPSVEFVSSNRIKLVKPAASTQASGAPKSPYRKRVTGESVGSRAGKQGGGGADGSEPLGTGGDEQRKRELHRRDQMEKQSAAYIFDTVSVDPQSELDYELSDLCEEEVIELS